VWWRWFEVFCLAGASGAPSTRIVELARRTDVFDPMVGCCDPSVGFEGGAMGHARDGRATTTHATGAAVRGSQVSNAALKMTRLVG